VTRAATVVFALLASACAVFGVEPPTTTTTITTSTTTTTLPPTTTTTLPPIEVAGTVVSPTGRPVVGAEVGFGDATALTDAGGGFRIATIAPGPLTVSKRGWTPIGIPWEPGTAMVSGVMEPATIRGLRVSAGAAGDDLVFQGLLDLAADSAVNALVFDSKQEGGQVLYQTSVGAAHEIGAVDPWYDPTERLARAHAAGLYTITRIVVFEDAFWVAAHPEEKLAGPWVRPTAPGARQYNIDLAVEACTLGFDEVQFDYVRYPAGQTAQRSGQLDISQAERVAAVEGFLAEARASLAPLGCAVSADVFAIVVSTIDDQGLGQRPEELSRHLDALSPMIYPSHYSPGWLGFPDPNDYPYEVTANAIDAALARIDDGAALRPWLQGFWWTNSQIREAIQAAEDRGLGWVLWNVRSYYERQALPGPDEIAGEEGSAPRSP
jgi:hypothetical protein